MTRRTASLALALAAALLTGAAPADGRIPHPAPLPETPVTARAVGTFQVKITPLAPEPGQESIGLGRFRLDKTFAGDLAGTGQGQMLGSMDEADNSGAYVALERVTGTLHGRSGSFMLHHSGVMVRGASTLRIEVVPGTGTGELAGIAGTFSLEMRDGAHHYVLDYTLPGG